MPDRMYYSEESEKTAHRQKLALGLSSLVIGAGIGTAVSLLFAPEEGEKLRKRISDTIGDNIEEGQDKVSKLIEELEDEYPDLSDRIRTALEKANIAQDD